ncbi:EMS1 [Symbiodinium sp. KB8]|nr:EMS1 [Symbiodinium sp. KB8]
MVKVYVLLSLCRFAATAVQEELDLALRLLSDLGARNGEAKKFVKTEDERVVSIYAPGRLLKGNIPAELGNLTALQILDLSANQLTGKIPAEISSLARLRVLALSYNNLAGPIPREICELASLHSLDLGHNKLTGQIPPGLGNMTNLVMLDLARNRLSGPIPMTMGPFISLQDLSLSDNQLTGPIPSEIADLPSLHSIHLSGNKLTGQIPPELGNMTKLLTLGLARNKLTGPIPPTIGSLSSLVFLTVAENQLNGKFPHEIVEQLPRLRVILLHKNFLEGQFPGHWSSAEGIQYLTLHENRFQGLLPTSLQNMTRLRYLTLHGNYFSGVVPGLNLPEHAKATLYRNRFSCELPANIGLDGVRATVVMGNMVGIGDKIAANWVFPEELQDFLYVSSTIWWGNVVVLAGLPVALLVVGVIYRQSYYQCGQPLAWSTAAYLDDSPATELFVSLVWSLATVHFSASVAVLPKPCEGLRGPPNRSWHLGRKLAWLLWIVPVTILSLPSILYVVAQALPKNNTLVSDSVLKIAHFTAPGLVVTLDMVLAARLSKWYAGLSGISADRLLMVLRSCSDWLLPLLAAVTLQENCLAGWKAWWEACDPDSEMNAAFNWALSDGLKILNTTTDMCSADPRNLWEGRCSRSVIEALSPLILQKLLFRIAVQPLVLILVWQASKLEDDWPLDEGGRQLRLLGRKTTGSLASMQQHAYFTTLLEIAIIWGPLVPLVSLGVAAAFLSSVMLLEMGLGFGIRLPTDAANREAGLSRSFLQLAVATSCFLQCWHAFGITMAGRTMLLLSTAVTGAVITLGLPPVLLPASRPPRRGPDADEQEMTEMEGASAEFPPLRISLPGVS